MEFANPYWDNRAKLDLLARWILIHSIIYYMLDTNVVEDHVYDNNCKMFVKIAKDKEALKQCRYEYIMKDFDGSTGFHLFSRLKPEDQHKFLNEAKYVVKNFGGK